MAGHRVVAVKSLADCNALACRFDRISKENGIKHLRAMTAAPGWQGRVEAAIIYDNATDAVLQQYNDKTGQWARTGSAPWSSGRA